MKYIFLDTNIFHNNWFAKNANFKLLFNYLENTGSVLLLSELVCEEIENNRKRELDSIVDMIKQEIKKSQKLKQNAIDFNPEQIKEESYNIKELLLDKVSNIVFISYEHISQNVVVKRALKRKKPFQDGEKGYRDTLIWLSFLDYLKSNAISEDIYFITNNKDDFFNKDKIDFHQDLKDDMENYKLECVIYPFDSLFAFTEKHIDKNEHGVNKTEFYDEHLNNIDSELEIESLYFINSIGEAAFNDILTNNRLRTFPYVSTLIAHSIELIEGVEDPEILSYSMLSKDIVYVNFRFNLRICILRFTVPNTEYYQNKEQIDNIYYEIKSDENYTTFCGYVRIFLDVTFEYNMAEKTIDGFNIESIDFK